MKLAAVCCWWTIQRGCSVSGEHDGIPSADANIRRSGAGCSASDAVRKNLLRLVPLLALGNFFNYIDRTNLGFAALTMNRDLGLTNAQFGAAAGMFFVGYCLFEVPSNLALYRFGARRWLARIMI
ncbi:hypothetical protein PQR59_31455 [Paraburkholderia graminis]